MTDLKPFFAPKSIAIIGASRREGTLGKMLLDTVLKMNYSGQIYPVNPKTDEINGIKCYHDIRGLPRIPDLGIILLPKEMVLPSIEELYLSKVKNVLVISAGFRESDVAGKKREEELAAAIKKYGMRMVGPNSMGIFNTDPGVSLNATFSPTLPNAGHIGFISQSGALGVAVLEISLAYNLGFSCFVSTGNKTDINDADCLEFLEKDKNTRVVILYQESIDQPNTFRKMARKIVKSKPVLTLKAGRTSRGLKAASSHTGALASDDSLLEAFLKQCGIIRCDSLDELIESAAIFAMGKQLTNNRIAIVTNAGGPGILATDALIKNNLSLAEFKNITIQKLRSVLPAEASVENPVDMIASADQSTYRKVCETVYHDPNVDALMLIIVRPPINASPRLIISELQSVFRNGSKPVIGVLMAARDHDAGIDIFNNLKIPIYVSPESAARSIGNLFKYTRIREKYRENDLQISKENLLKKNITKRQVKVTEIFKILAAGNLNICPNILTDKKEDAIRFWADKKRIVLKIANEEILHKSEHHLVKAGLSSEDEVSNAFDLIIDKASEILPNETRPEILVQEMIDGGVELILGAKTDPQFGKIIMFGLGGVLVELYKDVVFRILPIDSVDVTEMIEEIRGKEILKGFRNVPAINQKTLIKTILRFAGIIEKHMDIVEIDLNPLIWSQKYNDLIVVDSRCTMLNND